MPAGRFGRRVFLHGSGLAVGSGILLGACGSSDDTKTTPDASSTPSGSATQSDIALLNSSLDLENRAIAAYAAGAERLTGRLRSTAQRFEEHERDHASALTRAVEELGGTPNQPKDAGEYGFPEFEDSDAVLEFAVGVENTSVAWYLDALPKLSSPELRGRAASIITVEAEQLAVLLGALGKPQVPEAFVLGRKT